MKANYKKLLGASVLLLIVAVGIVWYIFTRKFTDTAEKQPDYIVSALDLIKEFQQNDSLANRKYVEKIIVVNGKVSAVEYADTTANIKFIDSLTGDYIIFAFQQQHLAAAKKLDEGQLVSIKGSCSGGTYSEILGTRYISFKRAAINK